MWSGGRRACRRRGRAEATPETQYRIGSITKTFTAVAVMQLRDAGQARPRRPPRAARSRDRERLADDPPDARAPLRPPAGGGGDVRRGTAPTVDELLAAMETYELVLPAARAHHYSNLAYALLGEVIARRAGLPYTEYVDERIIRPLALSRTTWQEQEPPPQGYLVDEYAGTADPRAAQRHGRRRGDGPALVDRRRPLPLGDVPRGRPRRHPRPGHGRRDVVASGDAEPGRLARRLGSRPRAPQPRRPDLRRPRRRDARVPGRSLHSPRVEGRRRRADELRHARRRRRISRSSSRRPRSTSGRPPSSPGSPRPSRRPRSARSSATGGRRGTSSSSRGRTGGCRPTFPARRPGSRRRSSSPPTVAAGASPRAVNEASGSASRASG